MFERRESHTHTQTKRAGVQTKLSYLYSSARAPNDLVFAFAYVLIIRNCFLNALTRQVHAMVAASFR